MGYWPGVKLWLLYLRSLHICKNYHIKAKYVINNRYIHSVSVQGRDNISREVNYDDHTSSKISNPT
jgi:hypothetical protein